MNRKPTHPGEVLREDVLPALGLSVSSFARGIGISRSLAHNILKGEKPITPYVALKIAKFTGTSAGLWARMQLNHDLWVKEREEADALENIITHHAA